MKPLKYGATLQANRGMTPFTVYLLMSCLSALTEAHSTLIPRMKFTDKETEMKRLPLPGHHAPVRILLNGEADTVTTVGQKHLFSFNFQNPQMKPVARTVLWKECSNSAQQRDCNYNITAVHETEESNHVFLCGTNGRGTLCCNMNLSEQSSMCSPSKKMASIQDSIRSFVIKEGESSVVVESGGSVDLYITYSGSGDYVGIHKFGRKRVGPAANQHKEQHYVGLVLSKQKDHLQDKVYAFYKERNGDTSMYSEMWFPFVSQVCMADEGGPKNSLQFMWTSQMNARLFCGDLDSRQHFSELIDVAAVHEVRWQDTRIYALFRNEWGMSAVCVYTMEDIDHIFQTSPFKGDQGDRERKCVSDSTKIPVKTLQMIEKTSEMEKWVLPEDNTGPLLINHHNYTRIYIDRSQHKRNNSHPVLFLSLNNGGIHKVIKSRSQSFLIAEFRPFSQRDHVLDIVLQTSTKKLYVNSRSELVQMDVANCSHYGNSCEECILARDPYCGWNRTHCTAESNGTAQDVAYGNHAICKPVLKDHHPQKAARYVPGKHAEEDVDSIRLSSKSKYFLQCPVSSHHAQYTWHKPKSSTSCNSREQQCLLLIDSMGPEQVGTYKCVSEEMGYQRVVAQYQLKLRSRAAGHSSSLLVWVCLMVVLIKNLSVSPE